MENQLFLAPGRSPQLEQGFSLVEVVLALGIAATALVVLIGLLPVGLQSNRESREESLAINAIHAMVADLKTSPRGSNSVAFDLPAIPVMGVVSSNSVERFLRDDLSLASSANEPGARFAVRATRQASPADDWSPIVYHFRVFWPAPAMNGGSARSSESIVSFPRP